MDLSSLIDLGKDLLKKPKFEKILGELSAEQINEELSSLTSELKNLDEKAEASLSGIGVENDETQEDKKLTREERRLNRQNRRQQRKEDREKKREELKRKKKELEQKIIPRFRAYTIRGRIFDSQTAEPLKGVKVRVGIDETQLTGERVNQVDLGVKTPKELDKVLQSDVKIAANFQPYIPVSVLIPDDQNTTTNKEGYYEFYILALVIGVEDENNLGEKRELKSLLELGLIFTKSGYLPTTTTIITLDNKVKRDIRTIGMLNIDKAAEKSKDEVNNAIYLAGSAANNLFLGAVEKIIVARKKSVQKVTNLLTTKLIPLLISILIAFGISKLSQKNQAKCPTPDQLKDAIKKRNKAVKQINQLFTAVIINTGLAAVFLVLANSLKGLRLSIDGLPFPMAVGTPPAKDFGGLIASIRYNLIARLQRIDDLLEELEDQNETLNKQVLIALAFLTAGLIVAKSLLKTSDELITKCAKDQIDSGEITLDELRDELKQLGEEEEEESPLKDNINGFILSVEEEKQQVGTLQRRFAVAKNKAGITLLKGEPSFSSTDKVLIDELAFYIKSNNLKAT